eukprot:COSAG05_NODE_1726_length_4205_cov_2.730151_4_plen_84_part_00
MYLADVGAHTWYVGADTIGYGLSTWFCHNPKFAAIVPTLHELMWSRLWSDLLLGRWQEGKAGLCCVTNGLWRQDASTEVEAAS